METCEDTTEESGRQLSFDKIQYLGMHIVSGKSLKVDVSIWIRNFYASANAIFCSSKYVSELPRLCLCESFVLPILTYGCEGVDLSTDNINRSNICWNDVYRKIFKSHHWESVKFVQLHCERLDLVRFVQMHKLKFLNRLFNSRNQVIYQCLSWCRRSNEYSKLCNKYDILGCSPLRFDVFAKFRYVCEGR